MFHCLKYLVVCSGSALGCALRVGEGGVPNEHGTWLYGRGGWCDGLQVNPWRIDVTSQVELSTDQHYICLCCEAPEGLTVMPAKGLHCMYKILVLQCCYILQRLRIHQSLHIIIKGVKGLNIVSFFPSQFITNMKVKLQNVSNHCYVTKPTHIHTFPY